MRRHRDDTERARVPGYISRRGSRSPWGPLVHWEELCRGPDRRSGCTPSRRLAVRERHAPADRRRPHASSDVWDVAIGGRTVALADSAVERMTRSRALLDDLRGEHTYGVNTGFGRFVSESIPDDQAEELQLRLLRSHACGVGEPYPDEVVRAAMVLRANAIAKGYSGARVETVELLLAVLERRHRPVRSGARARWARAATSRRSRTWRCRSSARARRSSTASRLPRGRGARGGGARRRSGCRRRKGLSLINGTQFMSAMASLGLVRARTARAWSPTSRARCRSRRCRAR